MHTRAGIIITCSFLAAVISAPMAAQPTASLPVPRVLPAPSVTSPKFAGSAFTVIALTNGSLLINDIRNHRVMLSDSLLRVTTVVIDSADYGARPASIMRYPGDSIVFVEANTPSMTLIDPAGKVVRSMGVPRPRDVNLLMPTPGSFPGVDSRGRFVHRGFAPRVEQPRIKPNEVRARASSDSNPVVRDDPVTHAGDTIAWVKANTSKSVEIGSPDGRGVGYSRQHPVDVTDQWVVLANGNVAVVRGRDYHIDVIMQDGTTRALPRIPYDWQHLSDDAKAAIADSSNREYNAQLRARMQGASSATGSTSGAVSGGGSIGGGMGSGAPSLQGRPLPPPGALDFTAADIPDYRAAFSDGAVRADAEGNVWIRTQRTVWDTSRAAYDIVNGTGQLIDRVLVPNNRSIVGFDRHGHVFLVGREDGGIQWIERVKWRK